MKHTFKKNTEETRSPDDMARAAGLTLTGPAGMRVNRADGIVEFDLPGVDALTEKQRRILDMFAARKLNRQNLPIGTDK